MRNDDIYYSTVDRQIEKLKQQGLIINDEKFAKSELQLYGYSNLIKSYRNPYTYLNNGVKMYRANVTFEQIWSLFILDKNLRNAVMGAMLDLEERVKEAVADVISNVFGCHQDQYLNFKNYRDKKRSKIQFTLSYILNDMRKRLKTDKNPIAHYMEKYEMVPPWILFKSITFSTIVNFLYLLKPSEQTAVSSKLYDKSKLNLDDRSLNFFMMDTLFICLEYRNLAAHGGRIYNHICDSQLRLSNNNIHGFSQLLFLLHSLEYQTPYEYLNKALTQQLNRHCSYFPEDVTYLGQILNINITRRTPVWKTTKSNKYHLDKHCSGIKSPIELDLSEAENQGLTPCHKCVTK